MPSRLRVSRTSSSRSMGTTGSATNKPIDIVEPHFVLGTPLKPEGAGGWAAQGLEHAVFGTGCFWGSEKGFWRLPNTTAFAPTERAGSGVVTTSVGYAGGSVPNASYEQVCSGRTEHSEVVLVVWDPRVLSFSDLMRQFLQSHDPTTPNRQGNDRGTQYRSVFYFSTPEQQRLGVAAIAKYEEQVKKAVVTEVKPLDDKTEYYFAEQNHQQYLARPGARPYCSAQPMGVQLAPFEEWCPEDLQAKYAPKLGEDFWAEHAPTPHCVIRQPHSPIKWPPGKL